jgi:hypothetical protein
MTEAERLMFWFQNVMKYDNMRYGRLQISVKSMGDAGISET